MPIIAPSLKNKILFRYRETKSYLINLNLMKKQKNKRVVIFAQGRTGSTLLEDLLHSTGYFNKSGEILSPARGGEIFFPIAFINGTSKLNINKSFTFHLKIYHLTGNRKQKKDPAKFLSTLYKNGWQIIYLKRTNKVKHQLSNLVAEHKGYHKFDNTKEDLSFKIDCESFAKGVEYRIQNEELEKTALKDIEYFQVVYEEDLEKPDCHQETVDKILNHLNLNTCPVKTNHKKVNTHSFQELIINYDEFYDLLKKKNWLKYLN